MQSEFAAVLRRLAGFARRRPTLAFSLILAVLLALLFFDPLFLTRAFTGRDLEAFFYPIERAVHDGWRSGHVPLILPELSWGKPLAANPNAGVFYPLRMAMALLPFPFAFKLFVVLHVWLAGVGAFGLSRFLGASRASGTLAGITFALCGPTLSEIAFPDFLPGLAAMPFVILAGAVLARNPGRARAAVFGAVWGATLLVGDAFTAGLALAGAVLVTIQESPSNRRATATMRLLAASLPGFLIAAIQAVPAVLLIPETVRALGRFPLRVALTWSVSLWRLLELVVRFPFGNVARASPIWGDALWSDKSAGFFVTLYVGVLGVVALVGARPPSGKRLFPYAFAGLSLVLAATGFYVPHSWLGKGSPIPLRYPEKLMVGFGLSAAILLGTMADRLLSGRRSRAWRSTLAVAMLVFVAAIALARMPHATELFARAHWTRYAAGAAAAGRRLPGILFRSGLLWTAGAVVVFVASRRIPRVAGALALSVFALFDLSISRFAFVRTAPESQVLGPPEAVAWVRAIDHGELYGFLPLGSYYLRNIPPDVLRNSLLLESAAMFGVFDVFNEDYDASDLYRVDLVRGVMTESESGKPPDAGAFLGAYSVRSTIVESGRQPPGFSSVGRMLGERWVLANPRALPLVRFTAEVEEVRTSGEAYSAIRDGKRDLTRTTVVETGRTGIRRLSSGSFRILRWDASRIEIETSSGGETRLLLPRAYFPYRTIRVDGARREFQAANVCLTSVSVPAGRHVVSCEEELPGGAAGPAISAVGLVVVGLCFRRIPGLRRATAPVDEAARSG